MLKIKWLYLFYSNVEIKENNKEIESNDEIMHRIKCKKRFWKEVTSWPTLKN